MKCELNTVYGAFVDTGHACHRLYFIFDYEWYRVSVKDAYDEEWSMLPIHSTPEHSYSCNYGVWRLYIRQGHEVRWELQKENKYGTYVHLANISVADEKDPQVKDAIVGELKGKHYDEIIEDDFPTTPEGAKKVVEWYERMQGVSLSTAKRRRVGIITNITEGGSEMTKSLYHVILFNRKTEEIDFKAYIPAKCDSDATMQAAQTYGKYNSNTHKVIVKHIECSEYKVTD